MVLEKTLESPLDFREIQLVHPKRNQFWIFIVKIDAEVATPPDVKNWFVGKDWRQEEKRMAEDEMIGWHHQLNGHEFRQALGVGDGQGSLACCSLWDHKESDMAERLNWTESNLIGILLTRENLDTQRDKKGVHTKERSCEDTVRRQPSASQGRRP